MGEPSRTPVPADLIPQAGPGATQPQISYICDLLDKKNLYSWPEFFDRANAMDREEYHEYVDSIKQSVAGLANAADGKKRASDIITVLRALPPMAPQDRQALARVTDVSAPSAPTGGRVYQATAKTRVEYADIETDSGIRHIGRIIVPGIERDVLAGSYGIDTSKDDRFVNDFSFFRVWIGDRGGWSVKLYVSDYTDRVTLQFKTQLDMIKLIAQDPEAASKAFGLEFGRCGVCGRGLTNDVSRELGIGPICRQNVGRY